MAPDVVDKDDLREAGHDLGGEAALRVAASGPLRVLPVRLLAAVDSQLEDVQHEVPRPPERPKLVLLEHALHKDALVVAHLVLPDEPGRAIRARRGDVGDLLGQVELRRHVAERVDVLPGQRRQLQTAGRCRLGRIRLRRLLRVRRVRLRLWRLGLFALRQLRCHRFLRRAPVAMAEDNARRQVLRSHHLRGLLRIRRICLRLWHLGLLTHQQLRRHRLLDGLRRHLRLEEPLDDIRSLDVLSHGTCARRGPGARNEKVAPGH
mmetsp:Transcript_62204/g.178947  ORF Transcript_62204/g.178947 Transcript_62204/m.178947 type:complete len:263 (+) Transcript_62204:263-1051(+)